MNNHIDRYQERLIINRIARQEAIKRFEEMQKHSDKTTGWQLLATAIVYAIVVWVMAYSIVGP